MRRILSILLFGLLLYNMVGYSLVYLSESTRSVSAHGSRYVQQAGAGDIVIKVPVAVPYQNDWDAPEPANGQIEHKGHFYQMKSRQLVNDTLYVQCERDQGARDRFSELVSKINEQVAGTTSGTQKGQHAVLLKNFLKEYLSSGRKHTFYVLEWVSARSAQYAEIKSARPEPYRNMPSPPPDLA